MEDYWVYFTRKEFHRGRVSVQAKSQEDAMQKVKEEDLSRRVAADRDFFSHEDEIKYAEVQDN